jgi:spoIIIJ-associated protein
MSEADTDKALLAQSTENLRGILERMKLDAEVVGTEDAERINLEVRGAESALVIGKHGAMLDALQYLVNKMNSSNSEDFPKPVSVDAEGYRQRRADSLVELAHRLADKARKSGRPVSASPMSPADRRIMHMALADATDVSTHSEGEGPSRHLVIQPGKRAASAPSAEE